MFNTSFAIIHPTISTYAENLFKMSKKNRIRLFAFQELETGLTYTPSEAQNHYLKNVMRLKSDDEVFLFDGINGEFRSIVCETGKKTLSLKVLEKVLNFEKSPDIWLLFSLLKKENTDIILQKAVELGVSRIIPVQTEYTVKQAFKVERAQTQIIEAAEQSRRLDVPVLENLTNFSDMLSNWSSNRRLIYLNETGQGSSFFDIQNSLKQPAALFVGPEGGLSKKELEILKNLPYTQSVTLGKRILRAETACISALACWQAFCGDWRN